MTKNEYINLECLSNITTGLCIFSMTPILFGLEGASIIGCIPWMIAALPIFIISIIWLFKSGDLVSGFATSILSGITLVGNAYSAMLELYIEGNNIALSNQTISSISISSGAVMLAAAFILLSLTLITLKENVLQAFFLFCACIGFLGISLNSLHILNLGILPGVLLFVFALWQMYSGVGILIFSLKKEEVFPFLNLVRE
ncbi:MAG: hypothetical protein PQJ49_06660 [Sphaerochaetaceae bacterium]|nr:hypothetical protein [Sphaerochaetaceae bacterium]